MQWTPFAWNQWIITYGIYGNKHHYGLTITNSKQEKTTADKWLAADSIIRMIITKLWDELIQEFGKLRIFRLSVRLANSYWGRHNIAWYFWNDKIIF